MRLVAYEKVPPMICSSVNVPHTSPRSPEQFSSPCIQRKQRHMQQSSSFPASLDIMRLSKRFQPQPRQSQLEDEQEQEYDQNHRQFSKKKRSDYTQDISLLEFTPEKPTHLEEKFGEDREVSGGEVEVSFFNEEQECSFSGEPIVNKNEISTSISIAPLRQPISISVSREKKRKDAQASGTLETLENLNSFNQRKNAARGASLITSQDEAMFSKDMVAASTLYDFPVGYSSSPSTPFLADVSPNKLIEICKGFLVSDLLDAPCVESLRRLLMTKYDWIIPQTRIGELEAALASTSTAAESADNIVDEATTANATHLDSDNYDADSWMRTYNRNRSAECIREKWGLFEVK